MAGKLLSRTLLINVLYDLSRNFKLAISYYVGFMWLPITHGRNLLRVAVPTLARNFSRQMVHMEPYKALYCGSYIHMEMHIWA